MAESTSGRTFSGSHLPDRKGDRGGGHHYRRTIAAGQAAVGILREGVQAGKLDLSPKERQWLDRIERELGDLPDEEEELLASLDSHSFASASYGLAEPIPV